MNVAFHSQSSGQTIKGLFQQAMCIVGAGFFVLFMGDGVTKARAGSSSVVKASYHISAPVGGGRFHYTSRFNGNNYSMNGSAHFKAIFGFVNWRSNMSSTGRMVSYKPKPHNYSFKARSSKKRENVSLRFSGSRISSIKAYPPLKKGRNRVPLQKSHLVGVVDPLSAVIAFQDNNPSLKNGAKACNRTVELFDGRQRFRLHMSYKRRTNVRLANSKRHVAFVCRVKYRPIAGYKKTNKALNYVAKSPNIEIWLIPVPKAKIYLPYRISVPIVIGIARAELASFTVRDSKAGVIALRR